MGKDQKDLFPGKGHSEVMKGQELGGCPENWANLGKKGKMGRKVSKGKKRYAPNGNRSAFSSSNLRRTWGRRGDTPVLV